MSDFKEEEKFTWSFIEYLRCGSQNEWYECMETSGTTLQIVQLKLLMSDLLDLLSREGKSLF